MPLKQSQQQSHAQLTAPIQRQPTLKSATQAHRSICYYNYYNEFIYNNVPFTSFFLLWQLQPVVAFFLCCLFENSISLSTLYLTIICKLQLFFIYKYTYMLYCVHCNDYELLLIQIETVHVFQLKQERKTCSKCNENDQIKNEVNILNNR